MLVRDLAQTRVDRFYLVEQGPNDARLQTNLADGVCETAVVSGAINSSGHRPLNQAFGVPLALLEISPRR
jgi:hypothetical protein